MKMQIATVDDTVVSSFDFTNPKHPGEVAHFIAELEVAKEKLIRVWKELSN